VKVLRNGKKVKMERSAVKAAEGLSRSQRRSLFSGGKLRKLAESIPEEEEEEEGVEFDEEELSTMELRTGKKIHYRDIDSLSLVSKTNLLSIGEAKVSTLAAAASTSTSAPLRASTPSTSSTFLLPDLPQPKRIFYSRHRHAQICPPFDNNHCSFDGHFCGFPRAPASRFCLSHAQHGATKHAFERCCFSQGARECRRFIPKSNNSQTV
jgi:hypothetical protein